MIAITSSLKKTKINKARLIRLIKFVFACRKINSPGLSVVLCGNKFIQKLNRKYFGRNEPTDVIAFPLKDDIGPVDILGEVIISLDQVKSNALFYKVRFEQELALCIIHGILHLLGYRDGSQRQRSIMEQAQQAILEKAKSLKIV